MSDSFTQFLFTFSGLYDENNPFLAIFSSFTSVRRYFIESMVAQDKRCLPQQSGFTIHDLTISLSPQVNSFALVQMAQHDQSVVYRSCDGLSWSLWPTLFVSLTSIFWLQLLYMCATDPCKPNTPFGTSCDPFSQFTTTHLAGPCAFSCCAYWHCL